MTSTLSQLLFVYALGGLTFIPLVLAAVLVPAWLALPKLKEGGRGKQKSSNGEDGDDEKAKEKLAVSQEEQYASDGEDGTASGTFAVLRKYDLAAANAALVARGGGSNVGGASAGTDGAADGLVGSESVYQSMYRSVFDRSRMTTPPNALSNESDQESKSATDAKTRRKMSRPAPANVFFIVLRHGHLMLYDSQAQLEVRHVIRLAHHSVSLSDGERSDLDVEEPMTEGDLFIKRTAILLTPLAAVSNGTTQAQVLAPKPFYLFTSTSIQKESFYHALLLASPASPTPQPLNPHDLIKLQTALHSTLITSETRALNAIISRIFLALSGTDQLKHFIRAKIEKKISRVQKPGFINALALHEIDLGSAAPVVANLRLKDLNISGDVTVSCDVRYTGGISLAIAAQARLDLGPRFKARTVDLLLSSSLKRLSGHMLIRIKPPPSNRLWFCFDGMPDMEIKIEPVVSSRQITYGFILRQIEERVRGVIAETLVKPNWDDIPFFDTRSQEVRGGIWTSKRGDAADGEGTPTEADMLARKGSKAMSMPVLPQPDADAEGASSGTETPRRDGDAALTRRSIVSLPAQTSSTPHLPTNDSEERVPIAQPPRPLRSPSLTSPSASAPSVALDDSSANFDPSHKLPPQRARTWGRRQMAPPPTRKEAVDAMREVRDRSLHMRDAESAASSSEAAADRSITSEDDNGFVSGMATPDRSTTGFSTASTASSASASTAASAKAESVRQKKAANLLAAATTATTAAKNWSWNAIQNRAAKNAAGRRTSDAPAAPTPQEPMGRGQPLPPPGTPLPGPQREKSLWAGSAFGVPGLSGSMKRKPVLPRRPTERVREEGGEGGGVGGGKGEVKGVEGGDEFGEWEENSGDQGAEVRRSLEQGGIDVAGEGKREVPPPLPKRRRTETGPPATSTSERNVSAPTPKHALDAARLATRGQTARNTNAANAEADLNTTTATLIPSTDPQHANAAEPTALPAEVVDPSAMPQTANSNSNSDPEDLVVVAAPLEESSGRNTPVAIPEEDDEQKPVEVSPQSAAQNERERVDQPSPRYDGAEWGGDDDDERWGYEDEDDEEEEGVPKASFSRSRGDGEDLHF